MAAADPWLLSGAPTRPAAVAFDALTILDPRPISARAEELFPGKGGLLADLWRTRQFEYTWLRTVMRTYVNFEQITEESLVYAANAAGLELPSERKQRLLQCLGSSGRGRTPEPLYEEVIGYIGYLARVLFEFQEGYVEDCREGLRTGGAARAASEHRLGSRVQA